MNRPSPFSAHYRQVLEEQESTKKPTNAKSNPANSFQNDSNSEAKSINIYKSLFDKDSPNSPKRAEPKIKVFGLGDKKNKKEEHISKATYSQNQEKQLFKSQEEPSCNLLDCLQAHIPPYEESIQKVSPKKQTPNQLQKLLQISAEIPSPSDSKKKEQNSPIKKALSLNSPPPVMFETQRIEKQKESLQKKYELFLNRKPLVEEQEESVKIDKTDSEFILPKVNEFQKQNQQKSVSNQGSYTNSMIIGLIESCADMFNESVDSKDEEKMRIKKKKEKQLKEVIEKKQSKVKIQIQQNQVESKIFQTLMKQERKPRIPKPPEIQPKKQKPKSIDIKHYLSVDNKYKHQINDLISHYEKVEGLKEKRNEIKNQLATLQQNKYQLKIDHSGEYFPERENATQNVRENMQISEPYISKKLFLSSENVNPTSGNYTTNLTDPQNELQKQLNKNVANMEKIIKKFKQLSKNIAHSEMGRSNYFSQSPPMILEENNQYFLEKYHKKNANVSRKRTPKQVSVIGPYSSTFQNGMKSVVSEFQIKKEASPSLSQSFEEVNLKRKDNVVTERVNPLLYTQKGQKNKLTTRTQKKASNANQTPESPIKSDHKKYQNQCDCNHNFEKELVRLNKKIENLEKEKRKTLRNVKSEETIKNKIAFTQRNPIKNERKSEEQIQKENVDQSIPKQPEVEYQHLPLSHKEKKSKRQSTDKISPKKKEKHEHQKASIRNILERKRISIEKEKEKFFPNEEELKRINIKFPIFNKIPSRNDNLVNLVKLGQYTFSILLKFLKNRNTFNFKPIKVSDNLKVKKYIDCVHYQVPNELNFHLIYYFSGKIYFGQWNQSQLDSDGFKHGFGYYYKPNKYIYEGQFSFNNKHGKGTLTYTNGQIYEGEWNKGKKQGYGLLINSSSDIYKGYFEKSKKNGEGEQHLNNGDFYKGAFKKGKLDGKGIYLWSDGSIYQGGFKDGLLCGHGIWKSKQNDTYEGQYRDNKKNGEGTYTWSNGLTFTGKFASDKTAYQMTPNMQYFDRKSPIPHSKRSSKETKLIRHSNQKNSKKKL